jgi:hypothetical protein
LPGADVKRHKGMMGGSASAQPAGKRRPLQRYACGQRGGEGGGGGGRNTGRGPRRRAPRLLLGGEGGGIFFFARGLRNGGEFGPLRAKFDRIGVETARNA